MVQNLHFRILKFPLIWYETQSGKGPKNGSHWSQAIQQVSACQCHPTGGPKTQLFAVWWLLISQISPQTRPYGSLGVSWTSWRFNGEGMTDDDSLGELGGLRCGLHAHQPFLCPRSGTGGLRAGESRQHGAWQRTEAQIPSQHYATPPRKAWFITLW